jgi:mRNA interferase YafQ
MLVPSYSTQFRIDFKRCKKRGWDMEKIAEVMRNIESEIPLPPKHKVHPLHGKYKNHMGCHIEPDWVLIFFLDEHANEVGFVRTGSHADLF